MRWCQIMIEISRSLTFIVCLWPQGIDQWATFHGMVVTDTWELRGLSLCSSLEGPSIPRVLEAWEADVFDTISQSPKNNMIQTIYQRSMRTDEVFQNSGMELLIEREIKTYGYYGKGQEGSGPQCLRSCLTCSTWSTIIEGSECWWDQRLLIISALGASGWAFLFCFILFYFDGCEKSSVHRTLTVCLGTAVTREGSCCLLP